MSIELSNNQFDDSFLRLFLRLCSSRVICRNWVLIRRTELRTRLMEQRWRIGCLCHRRFDTIGKRFALTSLSMNLGFVQHQVLVFPRSLGVTVYLFRLQFSSTRGRFIPTWKREDPQNWSLNAFPSSLHYVTCRRNGVVTRCNVLSKLLFRKSLFCNLFTRRLSSWARLENIAERRWRNCGIFSRDERQRNDK